MALLVVGFLGPWIPDGCSDTGTYNGVRITWFTLWAIVEWPGEFLLNGFPFRFLLVGLICIYCYLAVNLLAIVLRRQPLKRRALVTVFSGAAIGILVPAIEHVQPTGTFSSLLWGYWLIWVGLLSSMALEKVAADRVNDTDADARSASKAVPRGKPPKSANPKYPEYWHQ